MNYRHSMNGTGSYYVQSLRESHLTARQPRGASHHAKI